MTSYRLHRPEALDALVRSMITAAGRSESEAQETARHLVLANLSGHDSHGVGMIPLYFNALTDGNLKTTSKAEARLEAAPFLIVDANIALGQPAAHDATRRACAMTKAGGVAILNLLDAHHIGRIGHYAELAAAEGLISLFWVNVAGRAPIVAPYAAKQARFGTNPHAIGIPVPQSDPIILDFATSRMAHGKARVALNKGEQVPPGYIIDGEGRPTTEPKHVFQHEIPDLPLGALLPFGDHKGAGLSLIAELLSAGLMGAARIDQKPQKSWIINSLFGAIIDPARLEPDAGQRKARIESYLALVRAAAPQDPANPVLAPGDKERATRIARGRDGIPLDDYNSFCGALPATSHVMQWGGSHVWKVGGEVFAVAGWSQGSELAVTFKCSEMAFNTLKEQPGLQPAPYLASRGMIWIQRQTDETMPDDALLDYLRESHRLIAIKLPKRVRAELKLDG